MNVTLFSVTQRLVGLREVVGHGSHPLVLGMLRLDNPGVADDDTPWCSALVNFTAELLGLPRSHSLAARSWLDVGVPITLHEARPANDVVVFWRGAEDDGVHGHVGVYAGFDGASVLVLGGNQSNQVSIAPYPLSKLLGVRRLAA